MGVIKQGILGGFSGKVAGIVGSSWKGIAVVKGLPLSVSNPRSEGQVSQRGKMSTAVRYGRDLLAALIQPYWNPFAQRMSGFNLFISTNIASFGATNLETPADFYSQRGALLGVAGLTATADDSANTVTVNWTNNTGQADALGTDEVVVAYWNATTDKWVVDAGNAIRSAGTLVISDSVMTTGDVLSIYVGFSRPNISKVSDSSYISATVVA